MRFQWLEAALPLGIIAGMLCIMGNGQYQIHKVAHGRPKHIGNDMWDVAMERRDKKLVEQAASASNYPRFMVRFALKPQRTFAPQVRFALFRTLAESFVD